MTRDVVGGGDGVTDESVVEMMGPEDWVVLAGTSVVDMLGVGADPEQLIARR